MLWVQKKDRIVFFSILALCFCSFIYYLLLALFSFIILFSLLSVSFVTWLLHVFMQPTHFLQGWRASKATIKLMHLKLKYSLYRHYKEWTFIFAYFSDYWKIFYMQRYIQSQVAYKKKMYFSREKFMYSTIFYVPVGLMIFCIFILFSFWE